MYSTFYNLGLGLIRDHLRNDFQKQIVSPVGLNVYQLWDGLLQYLTICQGDCHVQNSYIDKSGNVIAFFDFQLNIIANFCRDISYFIGTALCTENRRKYEKELIEYYLNCLKKE